MKATRFDNITVDGAKLVPEHTGLNEISDENTHMHSMCVRLTSYRQPITSDMNWLMNIKRMIEENTTDHCINV